MSKDKGWIKFAGRAFYTDDSGQAAMVAGFEFITRFGGYGNLTCQARLFVLDLDKVTMFRLYNFSW